MDIFGHRKEIAVQLTFDAMLKCKCVTCPVQTGSLCSKPKIESRLNLIRNVEMSKNPETAKSMNPEDARKMMPDFVNSEGMMKNIDMMRSITPEQMMKMSREDQKKMSDEMKKNVPQEQYEQAKPRVDEMPGPYCANGIAACKDLDFTKMCVCSDCQVYTDYHLMKAKPALYFCKDGKAT